MENNLDRKRLKSSYPEDIKQTAYLIAFNPDRLVYYGSQSKKAMYLSSGDVDLLEPVNLRKAGELASKIQKIVKAVESQPLCYLADFKSGVDDYYVVDIGTVRDGKVVGFNRDKVANFVSARDFKHKDEILEALGKRMTAKHYYHLEELLRKDQIIRWNREELLNGYKLIRGEKLMLEDAIKRKDAMTKIDVIRFLPSLGRFVEVTNYFHLDSSPTKFSQVKFIDELKENLAKCYYTNNFFKMAKRMMSLLIAKQQMRQAGRLYPILHSGVGIMYQIKSELDAILYILEHSDSIPTAHIRKQLDTIKYRLGNVYEFDFHEDKLDKFITGLMKVTSLTRLQEGITKLKDHLSDIINQETYKELKDLGFIPVKSSYLP
jgi:hypothetical protein